ncbi:hypothetical protein OG689_16140 [Kitasatospora sp. NBC_00240]|uniref:hypothetical protein n=1 Tax=Kitasatospora sp. NBC_00240 TaxID=2903567 RepID=UPI0022561688|nr:hypothetical protein [Kitasatospora sp. NBC_00240]MCX5210801.1 hypothetical protein [Kitasatospora sp. NBC_00240]
MSRPSNDLWIDAEGRTVRFEQWIQSAHGPAHDTVAFKDFGPAESFSAPAMD